MTSALCPPPRPPGRMNSVYSRAKRSLYSNAGRWFPQPWFLPPPGGTWKRQSLRTRPGPDNSDTLGGTVRSAAIKPGGCGVGGVHARVCLWEAWGLWGPRASKPRAKPGVSVLCTQLCQAAPPSPLPLLRQQTLEPQGSLGTSVGKLLLQRVR